MAKAVQTPIWGSIFPFFGDESGESLAGSQAPPSFWKVPRLPQKFPKLPRVELNSIKGFPEVSQTSRKFPGLPRKFPGLPGGQPLSLGSLTPSPDSQKLSLNFEGHFGPFQACSHFPFLSHFPRIVVSGSLTRPDPKGPFRTKNAIAMEIVVFCYRGSILLSALIRCHSSQENSIQITTAVVNYYRGSELLSP